jgi:hypothetical protein
MSEVMWSFRGTSMMETDEAGNTVRFGILLNLVDHGPPEVGGSDVNVPRRSGMILRPRYAKRRILTAEGSVVGFDRDDWRDYTDDLWAAMDRSLDPGELVVYSPYLGYSSDVSIMARCIRAVPGPIVNRMRAQSWTFELEAVDTLDWEPYES